MAAAHPPALLLFGSTPPISAQPLSSTARRFSRRQLGTPPEPNPRGVQRSPGLQREHGHHGGEARCTSIKKKAISAALTAPHSSPVSRAAMMESAREAVAGPAEAMTLVAAPTFLGPIVPDCGDTTRVHQGRMASAQLLYAHAVPVGLRRQTVNQSRPSDREERVQGHATQRMDLSY